MNRAQALKFLFGWTLVLGIFLPMGCNTTETAGKTYFAVTLDSSWQSADSLAVQWIRSPGDTVLVFNDYKPKNENAIQVLAEGYDGKSVALILKGYQQGTLILEQERFFDIASKSITRLDEKTFPIDTSPTDTNQVLPTDSIVIPDSLPLSAKITPVSPRTIGDSLRFSAKVASHGSMLKSYAWDYLGDRVFEDSGKIQDTVATLSAGHLYQYAGEYTVRLKVTNAAGGIAFDSIKIVIHQDKPMANAGPNIEARAKSQVILTGSGLDTLGNIIKREWQLGNSTFQMVESNGKITFNIPDTTELIRCVFRVTDDDNQSDSDTLYITVVPLGSPLLSPLTPADTTISIGDTITFRTKATPGDTGIESITWDLGTGIYGSVQPIPSGTLNFSQGYRASKQAVTLNIRARLLDSAGQLANVNTTVKVVIDSPTVHAGNDTSLSVDGIIRLNGKAQDGLGRIVKTEWRMGSVYRVASPDTQFTATTPGTFTFAFRATDDDGLIATDSVTVLVNAATSTHLSTLSLVSVPFDVAFQPTRYAYQANVVNSVTSVRLTASVPTNDHSTIKVDGALLTSGAITAPITAKIGNTVITVVVTAQDGITQKAYVITVVREGNTNTYLDSLISSSGSLSPVFSPALDTFTLSATYFTQAIAFKAKPQANTTKLTLNGAALSPGVWSDSIYLTTALTLVRIGTLSEAGTTKSYVVKILHDTIRDDLLSDFNTRKDVNSLDGYWGYFDDRADLGNTLITSGDTTNPQTTTVNVNSWDAGYNNSAGAFVLGFRYGTIQPVCGGGCTYDNYAALRAGFGSNNVTPIDLTGATAFSFYAKADTTLSVRFMVETDDIKDFAYYEVKLSITTNWNLYTIYLQPGLGPNVLAQPPWTADPLPFNSRVVTGIEIKATAGDNPGLKSSRLLIDDVKILNWRRP